MKQKSHKKHRISTIRIRQKSEFGHLDRIRLKNVMRNAGIVC